ncbi:flagellar basal body L-ring protein FlgH [Vibrio sp.]|nr:flagellar basal body L-ring protein FlgH [Vibrio sp.]
MQQWVTMVLILFGLSGCALREELQDEKEQEQTTTVVDAVEGDKAEEEESSGIVDRLRRRTDPLAGDPAWAPIHPNHPSEHYIAETGSLFNSVTASSMYDDSKPHGIGDIITVILDENTNASKSADANLAKSNSSSMDPLSVGGDELTIQGYTFSYDLQNDNNFNGNSAANQSNSMSGAISVQVIEVLANGNLVVRGEKWLTLNTGDEYVRLSGTIRSDDITYENTIASNRVSNARIQYSGTGTNQDMQEPGFLARFFNVAL